MSDSNVGLGMVPHRKSCRCDECEVERLSRQRELLRGLLRDARAWLDEGHCPKLIARIDAELQS